MIYVSILSIYCRGCPSLKVLPTYIHTSIESRPSTESICYDVHICPRKRVYIVKYSQIIRKLSAFFQPFKTFKQISFRPMTLLVPQVFTPEEHGGGEWNLVKTSNTPVPRLICGGGQHPVCLNSHDSVVLGSDPGTGYRVMTVKWGWGWVMTEMMKGTSS